MFTLCKCFTFVSRFFLHQHLLSAVLLLPPCAKCFTFLSFFSLAPAPPLQYFSAGSFASRFLAATSFTHSRLVFCLISVTGVLPLCLLLLSFLFNSIQHSHATVSYFQLLSMFFSAVLSYATVWYCFLFVMELCRVAFVQLQLCVVLCICCKSTLNY